MTETTDDASTATPASPADLSAFRGAFRRHAAGVAIVTVRREDGSPAGFTATSLASLSAIPPLASFNMARSASTWSAIVAAEYVGIHILGAHNRGLAEKMAADVEHRFDDVDWTTGPHGVPVLAGATAWMSARILERVSVHNNAVVIAQIIDGALGGDDAPLLYHERRYHAPGEVV